MQESTFRYYQLKISAKKLPGKGLRVDPIAVVFTGGDGSWNEVDRTEKRFNEWNPKFSKSVNLPADNDKQRRAQVRIDFYNKQVVDSKFLGTCETNLATLLQSEGSNIELDMASSVESGKQSKCKVYVSASEGYTAPSGTASISLQLAQTNYYGVSMTLYYEISRAGNEQWFPVFKSGHTQIDEQGWGQFQSATMALRDLTMDEESTGLLFSIYRHRILGTRKLMGHFQATLKQLTRLSEGEFLPFNGNAKEDLLSADVQVLHARKVGMDYDVSFKLVNCVWRAPLIPPPKQK